MAHQRKQNDDGYGGGEGDEDDDDDNDERDFVPNTKLRSASTKPDQLHSKSADNVRSHRYPSNACIPEGSGSFLCVVFLTIPSPTHCPVRGTLTMTFILEQEEKNKGKRKKRKREKKFYP